MEMLPIFQFSRCSWLNHPVPHSLVAGSHTHCKSAVQSALRGESFLDGIWHEEEEEPGETKGGSH